MEMDEYEVEQKESFCYRAMCCWNFKKFHSDSPQEKSKRDSDIFYRRFSDLQQQNQIDAEDNNDAELVYDEEIFYTDGTLMLGESLPLKVHEEKLSPQGRIDDSTQVEVDLGVGMQVAFHNKRVDEGVQTDTPMEEDKGSHYCERCQRLHEALLADDHWFGDDNRNICKMESVTSSATWWTTTDSVAADKNNDSCQHKLRTAKSESDTRGIENAKHQTALDIIDNRVTRIGRIKSDGVAYGYKFCWDNLTSSDNDTDVQSPDSSFAGMHDFEEGSMEMESPFLDSNESLLSEEMMARCEFESPSSSYREHLENKNNRIQDIHFHNKVSGKPIIEITLL